VINPATDTVTVATTRKGWRSVISSGLVGDQFGVEGGRVAGLSR
jgi:hypothetical protein